MLMQNRGIKNSKVSLNTLQHKVMEYSYQIEQTAHKLHI